MCTSRCPRLLGNVSSDTKTAPIFPPGLYETTEPYQKLRPTGGAQSKGDPRMTIHKVSNPSLNTRSARGSELGSIEKHRGG